MQPPRILYLKFKQKFKKQELKPFFVIRIDLDLHNFLIIGTHCSTTARITLHTQHQKWRSIERLYAPSILILNVYRQNCSESEILGRTLWNFEEICVCISGENLF